MSMCQAFSRCINNGILFLITTQLGGYYHYHSHFKNQNSKAWRIQVNGQITKKIVAVQPRSEPWLAWIQSTCLPFLLHTLLVAPNTTQIYLDFLFFFFYLDVLKELWIWSSYPHVFLYHVSPFLISCPAVLSESSRIFLPMPQYTSVSLLIACNL